MRKGFTLIEILVVTSIISLISSVTITSTGTAKAKGRDALRAEQVRQINNATQLYISANGKAPNFNNPNCDAQPDTPPDISSASNCLASASATFGSVQRDNWDAFKTQLSPYIKNLKDDPCGSAGCKSKDGEYTGYTYVAPYAMQYMCESVSNVYCADSYQIYSPAETKNNYISGNPGNGEDYFGKIVANANKTVNVAVVFSGTSAFYPMMMINTPNGSYTCNQSQGSCTYSLKNGEHLGAIFSYVPDAGDVFDGWTDNYGNTFCSGQMCNVTIDTAAHTSDIVLTAHYHYDASKVFH